MPLLNTTPVTLNDRLDRLEAAVLGDGAICLDNVNSVYVLTGAGAPTDDVTGKDQAGPGSLYVDYSNATLYINTGTKASPYWLVAGVQAS
jgi:hypothetical protein